MTDLDKMSLKEKDKLLRGDYPGISESTAAAKGH